MIARRYRFHRSPHMSLRFQICPLSYSQTPVLKKQKYTPARIRFFYVGLILGLLFSSPLAYQSKEHIRSLCLNDKRGLTGERNRLSMPSSIISLQ